MASDSIAKLVDHEVYPGNKALLKEDLEHYIRSNAKLSYHPVGTCRMGSDDEAVVTPDLRVQDIRNLWNADASIMPDLISGNTNAVCMMIGAKLGNQLAQEM